MSKNTIGLAVSSFCFLSFGVIAVEASSCDDAVTTYEMSICVKQDFDDADAELNRVYQNLRKSSDKKGKLLLRDAQRAWISFRDAECERQADMARGGTVAPLINMGCMADLTQKRVIELNTNPLTGGTN